jgi:predicted nuclease of predicted toxin-antitoxin system
MRVYLDDNLDSNALIGLLQQAGHEVFSPRVLGTRGVADEDHLSHAAERRLVLITADAQDFVRLHHAWRSQQRDHQGILIVYQENNPARDMNFQQIAGAVTQIENSGLHLTNTYHNLKFWRQRGN